MDENYFNINGLMPNFQGPTGLAGMLAYQQQQNYQRQVDLQDIRNTQSTREYLEDTPMRAAQTRSQQSQYELADALNRARNGQPYLQAVVSGDIGDAQVKAAKGKQAQGTVDSSIAAENDDNQFRLLASAAQRLQTLSANPAYAQADWKQFRDGLPDNLKNSLPETYTPDLPGKLMDAVSNGISQRQKMSQIKEENAGKANVANIQGATYRDVANTKADAQVEAAWARMGGSAAKNKVESIINQYLQLQMDGKPTTPQQDRAFIAAQTILNNVHQAAGLPMDPNMAKWMLLFGDKAPPPRPVPQVVPPFGGQQPGGPVVSPGQGGGLPGQTVAPQMPNLPQGSQPASPQEAQAAFGTNYDPNGYVYIKGPDGRIGRIKR